VLDEDAQPPRRQRATVEVEQINPVLALQVGLYLGAVLVEQAPEAG
jgi:hypothetical protein